VRPAAHQDNRSDESSPDRPSRCGLYQDEAMAAIPGRDASGIENFEADPKWKWEESTDSQRAHAVLAGVLLIGALPWSQQFGFSSMLYLTSLAVCTIYIGAHKGLTTGMRQQLSIKEVGLLLWI
jgi:hypothetical protein